VHEELGFSILLAAKSWPIFEKYVLNILLILVDSVILSPTLLIKCVMLVLVLDLYLTISIIVFHRSFVSLIILE